MNSADLYEIRKTRQEESSNADYAAINRLERACAQGVTMKYYFASEDVNKPRAHKYDDFVILMVDHKPTGQAVATMTANVRSVHVANGRFEKGSWLCSLRVDPAHRRFGLAHRLVREMERVLRDEKGVTFIYVGLSADNVPSIRLFTEKLGYLPVFTESWPQVNIGHFARHKETLSANIDVSCVERLNQEASWQFLMEHFSSSFLFPENIETIKGNVYIAKIDDEFVAVHLFMSISLIGVLEVPLRERILRFGQSILSQFFPTYVETPFSLGKALSFMGAFPFLVKTKSPEKTKQLFQVLVTKISLDLVDQCDVLFFASASKVANIGKKSDAEVIMQCFGSSISWGDTFAVKSLRSTAEERNALFEAARQANVWFMDAREL